MAPETNKSAKIADKMKTVKAAWDEAPSGLKKVAAQKHYQAAEKAHSTKNDTGTYKSLDAAMHALK